MKKTLLIFLFIQSVICSQEVFKGDIFISELSAQCVDTSYIAAVATRERPLYKKDKLIYKVILKLKLYGNDYSYNSAIAFIFKTPDNNTTTIIANQDLYPLTVGEDYEYVFNIQSKEKGWVNVELNEWDIHSLVIQNNTNVNFLNYSFYIDQ